METHSSILAWRIHGQRSLADYRPWCRKESDTTERLAHTHAHAHTHTHMHTHTILIIKREVGDALPHSQQPGRSLADFSLHES